MRDPTVAGGQSANSSLAPSSGEADAIMAQLSDFLEIDDLSRQYARVLLALFTGRADDIAGEFYRTVQRSVIGSYVTDDAVERLVSK